MGVKFNNYFIKYQLKHLQKKATADLHVVKNILKLKGGEHYRIHDPGIWPLQAALLRDGKLQEFVDLVTYLKWGKEPEPKQEDKQNDSNEEIMEA